MKILTWNLGLFSWFKYGPYLGLKIHGKKIEHEYFQKQHLETIAQRVEKINPDICIFQEFFEERDRLLIISKLNKKYTYHCSLPSWYHDHTIMIFSREKVEAQELAKTGFYILKTNNFSLIPIHLNSFVPGKRLKQIRNLLIEIDKTEEKIDCIAGDTNFWYFFKKHFFVFKKDKIAYSLLAKEFSDTTQNINWTTKAFTNFDKIFLLKEIQYENPTCLKETEKYMDHYPVFVDVLI